MSYSLTPQIKKSKSFSKYLYSNIDQSEDFYIFNIELTNKKKFKKIKKVKNSKSGMIINQSDDILFSKYQKANIDIINISQPELSHSVEIKLKKKLSI